MSTAGHPHGLTLVWASDIHFPLASLYAAETWARSVSLAGADMLVLTGDISNCRRIYRDLDWISRTAARPALMETRFVLGNHDLLDAGYKEAETLEDVRDDLRGHLSARSGPDDLVYLHDLEPGDRKCEIPHQPGFVMLGVDGWWDGRAAVQDLKRKMSAEYRGSEVQKNIARYARRADLDTWKLRAHLDAILNAPGGPSHRGSPVTDVVLLTHVPPFPEACLYNGRPTDDTHIGYFSNVGLGNMLAEVAGAHRRIRFTVLCGHTHDDAYLRAAPNLHVFVQGAVHGAPSFQVVRFDPLTREPSVMRHGIAYERESAPFYGPHSSLTENQTATE